MDTQGKVALITGAGSGIGQAVAARLAQAGVKALALVDRNEAVEQIAKETAGMPGVSVAAETYIGDVVDPDFRAQVYDDMELRHGLVDICIPAAGITRDRLAVKIDKESGEAQIYPVDLFRQVVEVNLIAPVYWAMEMVGRIAKSRARSGAKRWQPPERVQGVVVFIGSVSSQGNKGQISYAATKSGLEGAASTLAKEAIFHGVRCTVVHPGFTDTPMVRAMGDEYINRNILPYTQLGRLIRPDEIADAITFLISNSAVSGELWADAGWHPSA